jgi:hypothetical protein
MAKVRKARNKSATAVRSEKTGQSTTRHDINCDQQLTRRMGYTVQLRQAVTSWRGRVIALTLALLLAIFSGIGKRLSDCLWDAIANRRLGLPSQSANVDSVVVRNGGMWRSGIDNNDTKVLLPKSAGGIPYVWTSNVGYEGRNYHREGTWLVADLTCHNTEAIVGRMRIDISTNDPVLYIEKFGTTAVPCLLLRTN